MLKIHYRRIIRIAFIWMCLGLFITAYDLLLLKSELSLGGSLDYIFNDALLFNILSGFFGGLMGGTVLTIVNRKFRNRPYYASLVTVLISFVLIISLITFISAIVPTFMKFDNTIGNPEAKAFFIRQVFNTMHVKNILFWAVVVVITHFSVQVGNKFGPGNLWNILIGKYHQPKLEKRVFMFLDLKSSTTIAEKLDGEKYHQFLKDVFADITDPIVRTQAEIYQYVGDEVVVSWSIDKVTNHRHYLNCFFAIQDELELKREKYMTKYNHIPEFKAGAHYGEVVAGEIGIIKRDITYSGDVLNTTARIQSLCKEFDTSFLISKPLFDFVQPNLYEWDIESKGNIKLRGKEVEVELLSVERIG